MSIQAREEDRLMPWQQSWNGLTWKDMPGQDFMEKSMNFALYRRGKLDLMMDGETRKLRVVQAFTGSLVSAAEKQRRAVGEKAARVAREMREVHLKRQAAVRTRLMRLRDGCVGSMKRIAEFSGFHVSTISQFVLGVKGLLPVNLQRMEEAMNELEGRPELLRRKTRVAKPVVPPSGYVPFKTWLSALAEKKKLMPHSIYAQIQRGDRRMPEIMKVNKRLWYVPEKEMEAFA